MKIAVLILALTGSVLAAHAQNSVKLKKQKTTFFYTQLNLHGGYINDINGQRWDLTSRGPNNQLAFQLFSKNKRNLQKGYVRSFSPVSYKLRFSLGFDKWVNGVGQKEADLRLTFFDTWVKFNTKWDRTSFTIGNKSIPYGHNPKLDPVSSFMTNMIKSDLGFAQDLGFFLKTPVADFLDWELSITSGGVLNKSLLICDNLIDDNAQQDLKPTVTFSNFDYNNTWLVTSRIGQPNYKKNEFGLIAIVGYIPSTLMANDFDRIYRIGGDFVHKHNEVFKVGNLVAIGQSQSNAEGKFFSYNLQNNADFFLKGKFIFSVSHALNGLKNFNTGDYHFNHTFANSFTYVFSPHTRFRFNQYYTYIKEADETQWGLLFQFVTGIGQRN
jgi:hypothetical protein